MRKSEKFIFSAEISLEPISDEDNASFNEVYQQSETLLIEEQHEIINENYLNSVIINQMERQAEENSLFNEDYQQIERPVEENVSFNEFHQQNEASVEENILLNEDYQQMERQVEENLSFNGDYQQSETLLIEEQHEIIKENALNSVTSSQQFESELEAFMLLLYKLFFFLFHLVFSLRFLKIKMLFLLSILFLCAGLYYFFDSKYIELIYYKSFELKSIDLTIRSM